MLNGTNLMKSLLILIALLLAAIVWTATLGEKAAAQEAGMGAGRFMIGVIGFWRDNSEPVFIIDTRKQTISVYEFDSEQDLLDLMAVRSYEYDRKLIEYPIRKGGGRSKRGRGPSVRKMMKAAGVG